MACKIEDESKITEGSEENRPSWKFHLKN